MIPVEHLHSPLITMITDHLKPLFVGDFSKSLIKDIAACLLSRFVLTYIKTYIMSDWQKLIYAGVTRSKSRLFGEIGLLPKKYFNMLSYMIRTKMLLQIGRRETGQ